MSYCGGQRHQHQCLDVEVSSDSEALNEELLPSIVPDVTTLSCLGSSEN